MTIIFYSSPTSRYTPPMSEVLKWAWIQYMSFFAVVSFLLFRLNSFVFRHQVNVNAFLHVVIMYFCIFVSVGTYRSCSWFGVGKARLNDIWTLRYRAQMRARPTLSSFYDSYCRTLWFLKPNRLWMVSSKWKSRQLNSSPTITAFCSSHKNMWPYGSSMQSCNISSQAVVERRVDPSSSCLDLKRQRCHSWSLGIG